jgi:hypothetical protein
VRRKNIAPKTQGMNGDSGSGRKIAQNEDFLPSPIKAWQMYVNI